MTKSIGIKLVVKLQTILIYIKDIRQLVVLRGGWIGLCHLMFIMNMKWGL